MLLSPKLIRHLIVIGLCVVAFVIAASAWNKALSFLPWSAESRLERREKELAIERDKRIAREIEATARESADKKSQAERDAADKIAKQADKLAEEARHASKEPISPDRADRIRDARKRLCAERPTVC